MASQWTGPWTRGGSFQHKSHREEDISRTNENKEKRGRHGDFGPSFAPAWSVTTGISVSLDLRKQHCLWGLGTVTGSLCPGIKRDHTCDMHRPQPGTAFVFSIENRVGSS